jgi:glycerate kinase
VSTRLRALCCPDKFRGSLSAPTAARRLAEGLRAAGLEARELPLGDGGEGTLDVLVAAAGGETRRRTVTGPLGAPVEAEWALLPDGTAVVEAARAAGLALTGGANDPVAATTAGVGELLHAAAEAGAQRALVCVGGSATTDGGLGAVDALGWSLGGLEVVVACDVATSFRDAAEVFGPQKGADPDQVRLLAERLDRLAATYRDRTGVDVARLGGGGAAGGLAGGLAALGATLRSGFDVVAEATGLGQAVAEAEVVVTGEGKVDSSSFHGKVVGGVLELAGGARRRAVIGGEVTAEARRAIPEGVVVDSLLDRADSAGEAFARAGDLLQEAALQLGRRLAGAGAE